MKDTVCLEMKDYFRLERMVLLLLKRKDPVEAKRILPPQTEGKDPVCLARKDPVLMKKNPVFLERKDPVRMERINPVWLKTQKIFQPERMKVDLSMMLIEPPRSSNLDPLRSLIQVHLEGVRNSSSK